MAVDVAIIGAGVSGLSIAHELRQNGFAIAVLERQVHAGGNAVSRRFDGFLMEQGPTTLNGAIPGAMDRIEALGLGDAAMPLGPNVRRRYLQNERGLQGISTHPLGFFMSGYLSPADRVSMLCEILRPQKTGEVDESIHQFASRRFGRGFADKVMDPMAAGIFMGDSRAISVAGAFPKLPEMEARFGSVTRGVLAAKRGSEPGRNMLSWSGGIGTIPKILAAGLGDSVKTGVTVKNITRNGAGFSLETTAHATLKARTVVLAVQPHVAAALLENLDPESADAASEIPAPPIGVVFLGYHRSQVAHPLDGLGYLSSKSAKRVISGAQFSSTMFDGRAPAGKVAISCYVGGARNPEVAQMCEPDLVGLVHRELADALQITGKPYLSRTHRWPRGLPQYTLGHALRSQVLQSSNDRVPGLFIVWAMIF